jgi:prepilin-type N-terminal cleavage/methylation domain-containing protein
MNPSNTYPYEGPAAPPRDRALTQNPAAPRPARKSCRRARRGLGLVELMISMSIVASLLTATAAAVNAAFLAYEGNQEQASLLSKARVALASISSSVRGTQLHAPDTAALRVQFAAGQTVTDTGLDMYDDADNLVRFYYDQPNKKLLVTNPSGTFTMARGVEAFNVTLEPMRSAASIRTGGSWDLLKRATITVTVRTASSTGPGESTGKQTLTLSGSVMPRKNAW